METSSSKEEALSSSLFCGFDLMIKDDLVKYNHFDMAEYIPNIYSLASAADRWYLST